ncbi:MAG: FAD-binding oxidoreductase [Verrucomicrobiaceae bacterium]|nr:MAG: FAD-binding oxidoreductase [Verrucomicrobiaceae bacterium]
MKRRHALGLTLAGLAAGGCRKETAAPPPPAPVRKDREGDQLVPVHVDPSLEIRTIAGLRPFRPSGFVVRREDVAGKILVHNYGHGGGGMTLSWGSSELAVRLAGDLSGVSCGVIGGGVMGLSTARLLQLRGASVTLYTAALPPDTTSNVAGAQWWPFSVFDSDRRTEEFGKQYIEAAAFSYQYFQRFVGPRMGIRWIPNYYLSNGPPKNGWIAGPGGVLHSMQVGFRDFGPGEHAFPANHVRRFHTMLIEPSIYLPELLAEVQGAGRGIVVRKMASMAEILALPHPVLFNCTGLGAKELCADPELIPIKGQLTFMIPQPAVDYNLLTEELYMFPRTDGILLGGTYEKGNWDATPDFARRDHIISAHRELFRKMAEIQRQI